MAEKVKISPVKILVFLLLTWSITVSHAADKWEGSKLEYVRENYPAVVKVLTPLADKGDISAQFNLGYLYEKGQGC